MSLLLIVGIAVILAGLAAVGFGIPVKEFGFGNTLILTGTIGFCTGLIMLGLSQMLNELRLVTRRPDVSDRARTPLPKREMPLPADDDDETDQEPPPAPERGPLFSRDQRPAEPAGSDHPASKPDDTVAEVKPRRNLLFSSSSRKERERAASAQTPDPDADLLPALPERPHNNASPVVPPAGPRTFDDAWPQSERPRMDAQRSAARPPSTFKDAAGAAERPAAIARPQEAAPVTVLKSGVVDGMAYSLYSDGSIEAQMPEGMMRFASIDELREHLDHRG